MDVTARQWAAAALRGFLAGHLTNAELDASYPGASPDRAVHEVYFKTWPYQDDFREYRVGHGTTLSSEERALLERCVLFLQTELPYEWPSRLERLGHWLKRRFARSTPAGVSAERGALEVWPFYRQEDWRVARERSRVTAPAG